MKFSALNNLSASKQYIAGSGLVIILSVICYFISPLIGYKVVALVLLFGVSALAMFFNLLPVLLAAFLSALIWDYFFIPPKFDLYVSQPEDVLMLCMYFIVVLLNGVLNFKSRQWEKLARLKEQKVNTLKLYNTLLNSLSHELRTPIATIIGATDNLKTDGQKLSQTDRKELIESISVSAIRLNDNVENLLNMSRLESGVIKPVLEWCDVNDLVHQTKHKLKDYSANHQINIIPEIALPLFKIDFGLIQQSVYNLLYNALIYTPARTIIEVRISQNNDNLIIIVSDNGPGFPEQEIEKVFEKFYRLKSTLTGGTGLGLSIVKGFIEAHNGTVSLENNRPSGAKFTLSIPAKSATPDKLKNE